MAHGQLGGRPRGPAQVGVPVEMRRISSYKVVIVLLPLILALCYPLAHSITPGRQPSEIAIYVSDQRVRLGDCVRVFGRIKPPIPGAEVRITYFRPDGSTINKTVTTFVFSIYEDVRFPDAPGVWSVMASWDGNDRYEGAVSNVASFVVEEPLNIRIW